MFERVIEELRELVSDVGARSWPGEEAAHMVSLFTEVERLGAAGRTIMARQVEASKVWQRAGHRTAADWMAATTGTTVSAAKETLATARRLEELPLTRAAFCAGQLSEIQTREISGAAYVDPRAEQSLVAAASTGTPVHTLRDRARSVRAAAQPDEQAHYRMLKANRYAKHWTDPDGSVRFDARLAPDDGAEVVEALRLRTERIFRRAQKMGRRESRQAYMADALGELARGSSGEAGSGPRALVQVNVDHAVLVSGVATAEQTCEIPGIGRIPAAKAQELAGDSILNVLVKKDADVVAVAHAGRTIPARVRTALGSRDPVCVVPDCGNRYGLEIDHWQIPFARGGRSTLENLARICRWHHHQKTHCGYQLVGGPGRWRWLTPTDLEGVPGDTDPPPDP